MLALRAFHGHQWVKSQQIPSHSSPMRIFILRQQLERFDEETASLLDPSKETMTNELRAQTGACH